MIEGLRSFNYNKKLIISLLKSKYGAVAVSVLAPVFYFIIFYGYTPTEILAVWLFLHLSVFIFRIAIGNKLSTILYTADEKGIKSLLKLYLLSISLSSFLWGISVIPALLYGEEAQQFILIAILFGMVAGSLSTLTPVFHAVFIFIFNIMFFAAVSLLLFADSSVHYYAVVMFIIFLFIVLPASYRIYKAISENIQINEEITLLNSTLEERVIEKTREIETYKERFELAFSGSNDGLWDWNLEDNSIYYSPRWKEMLGYKDSELENVFDSWKDRIHPDDAEQIFALVQEHMDKKISTYESIHRLKHKDGSWKWILARGKIQCDESGKAIRFIGTHTDITKEKEMENTLVELNNSLEDRVFEQTKELEKSKEILGNQYSILQKIIDTIPIRVFWKSREGAYLGANNLFLKDANLSSQNEIIGKTDFDMPWAESEAQSYRDDDMAVMNSGEARAQFEETQTDQDGKTIYLTTSKVPLKDVHGNLMGVLGT
ncbi:MAG: PAS domain-containing protein [Campylobacterota bacterium]